MFCGLHTCRCFEGYARVEYTQEKRPAVVRRGQCTTSQPLIAQLCDGHDM